MSEVPEQQHAFGGISGAVLWNSLYGFICTDEKAPYGTAFKDADWHRSIILFEGQDGHFPFEVTGAGLLIDANGKEKKCVDVSVNINDSSQFLSALLISLGAYAGESVIRVEGTHGMAYIDMTVRMMEQFGIKVQSENSVYKIAKQGGYKAKKYDIEPDVSAACYLCHGSTSWHFYYSFWRA